LNSKKGAGRALANKESLTDRSNVDVVILAAYLAGGGIRKVDTEDVAIKAQEISPGRFSWRKYPHQIDLERVRVRLSQAAHEGALSGVHSKGWRLTSTGSKHVEEHLLDLMRGKSARASVRKEDREWQAVEKKRLSQTTAYRKFIEGAQTSITMIDVGEFFRIDSYMGAGDRRTKLDRYLNAFRNDKKLGPIVEALSEFILQGGVS
jgi:hypothetical protein